MDNDMRKQLLAFLVALLDDDRGINKLAYSRLIELSEKDNDIVWLMSKVRCTEDRYYLPEDWKK